MNIIKPTIGRKVWYYDKPGEPEQDATIIDVHGDNMVSLYVINRGGTPSSKRSVWLQQPVNGEPTPDIPYCAWMPYQVGQAKTSEPQTKEQSN